MKSTDESVSPTYLYKYRSLEGDAKERTRQLIVENKVWFSRPSSFNDPFDCFPAVRKPEPNAVYREAMKIIREDNKYRSRGYHRAVYTIIRKDPKFVINASNFLPRMRKIVETVASSVGVLSLSACKDQMLMWTHYAASHTGICLRFKCNPGFSPFNVAHRVRYRKQRPVVDPLWGDNRDFAELALLTKAMFWDYEEEWRSISFKNSTIKPEGGSGFIPFDPRALDGIIFGARTSDSDMAEVTQWIRGREYPVELLRARPDPHRFHLNISPHTFYEAGEEEEFLSISGHPEKR